MLKTLLFFQCVFFGAGVVTEKDLQAQLGINVKAAKKVSWKDFVNNNPAARLTANGPLGPSVCVDYLPENAVNGSLNGCCGSNEDCGNNSTKMRCAESICRCERGYFLNKNGTDCEDRPKKELGQDCNKSRDNCYAAFAGCVNGTCSCKDGFVRVNDVCRPLEYTCPFKTPFLWKGIAWPCIYNSSRNYCPKDYTCIAPTEEEGPKFLTPSGKEQGYCCPSIPDISLPTEEPGRPDLTLAFLLSPVCFYGAPIGRDCPLGGGNDVQDYYYFRGIGLGPVCCPTPCYPDPMEAVIVNGKCTFPPTHYFRG